MWTKAMVGAMFLLGSACSSGPMQNGAQQMSSSLVDGHAETERYSHGCAVASSVPLVLKDLTAHEQAMATFMTDMGQAMGDMMSCSNADVNRVTADVSLMRSSLSTHRARLEASPDIRAAHDECSAYRTQMESVLNSTGNDFSGMSCMMSMMNR